MISFKQFISEDTANFDIEKFEQDCKFYLSEIGYSKTGIMYRGLRSTTNIDDVSIEKWQARTEPRDTPKQTHDIFNHALTDIFGAPIRNWMFVTGRDRDAEVYTRGNYANVAAIFPIGKFEWVCGLNAELTDMTGWLNHEMRQIEANKPPNGTKWFTPEEIRMLATKHMIDQLKDKDWKHNTDLQQCIDSQNEIMIKCDTYYQIRIGSPAFKQIINYVL